MASFMISMKSVCVVPSSGKDLKGTKNYTTYCNVVMVLIGPSVSKYRNIVISVLLPC